MNAGPPPPSPETGGGRRDRGPADRTGALGRGGSLVLRVVSGVVIGGAVLALLIGGRRYGAWAIVVGLGGMALWEFRQLSDRLGFRAPSWLVYPLGAYFAFSGTLLRTIPVELVLSVALIAGLTAFLFLPGRRGGLGRWAMGMAGGLYVGLPFNYYLLLLTSAPWPRGLAWLLLVVLAAVASDAAAYFGGRAFGRHPFFPDISPRKTVEGALAGLALSVGVMLAGGVWVLRIGTPHAVALGLLIGLGAVLGDLVESQIKRVAGVKDSSRLIPGHGGVLDRIDSLLFPPVVAFIYASYLHLL